jgi:hypothetical protein
LNRVAIACYLGHFSLSGREAAGGGDEPPAWDKMGDNCGDNQKSGAG